MSDKVKVVRKRRFSLHHALIREARAAVKHAEEKLPGWGDRPLNAIILCGHAIEAICNAVGDRVVTDWKDFERNSPKTKVPLLCERLKVKYDKNREPWSTVCWLLEQRDAIAHAKPQQIRKEEVRSRDKYDRRLGDYPPSDLERQLTLANAKRSLTATKEVLKRLTEAIPDEDRLGLNSDSWEGSASAMHDN